MNWVILIIAGLFEVGFTTCLGKAKATSGVISTYWLVGFFICLTLSMLLLYKATQTLPLGTAYAVWTGIGAVGTALVGILFFKEKINKQNFIGILLAITAVILVTNL